MPERGVLTEKQATGGKGCGLGTDRSCFGVICTGKDGYRCQPEANPYLFYIAARRRPNTVKPEFNIDEKDGRPWCPLGVLSRSKTSPELLVEIENS